jgi:hypothetical protein
MTQKKKLQFVNIRPELSRNAAFPVPWMIKSMITEDRAYTASIKNAYKIFVAKSEGKRPDVDGRIMDHKEIECEGVDWTK